MEELEEKVLPATYQQTFRVDSSLTDRYGRLKSSQMLWMIQEISGQHSAAMGLDWEYLATRSMFWAVVRHRVQINRVPKINQVLTLETWPCPTTRVAYPRSVICRDEDGKELFRSMTLWVLMNLHTRDMILPGNSGVEVEGHLMGNELDSPVSLHPITVGRLQCRQVRYSDLDRNGHMNNTRYMDWVDDLMPSQFHRDHSLRELEVCYLSEMREGQGLDMTYELFPNGMYRTDMYRDRKNGGAPERVFASRSIYS